MFALMIVLKYKRKVANFFVLFLELQFHFGKTCSDHCLLFKSYFLNTGISIVHLHLYMLVYSNMLYWSLFSKDGVKCCVKVHWHTAALSLKRKVLCNSHLNLLQFMCVWMHFDTNGHYFCIIMVFQHWNIKVEATKIHFCQKNWKHFRNALNMWTL